MMRQNQLSQFHSARVLVVEDALPLVMQYRIHLKTLGVSSPVIATDVAEALNQLDAGPWDLALIDIGLPDGSGFQVMDRLLARWPECAVVVISGLETMDLAVHAAHAGATDFLQKPFQPERLVITLRNALQTASLRRQLKGWTTQKTDRFYGFIGRSEVMQSAYLTIQTIAASHAPVHIHGESGAGKELAADAIHQTSERAQKPFIPVNCASIPLDLIESELFGHVRGAFTGAHADRDGAFVLADGGTLFLDEIAELDIQVQAKLLRVLQTGELRRLGDSKTKIVNVRVISASHRNLQACVRHGTFREDLFYRLHVIPVNLPPLRERGEDILLLAHHFLKIYAKQEGKQLEGFTPEAQSVLLRHPWPGNVRELINTIRAVVALNSGDFVDLSMLPQSVKTEINWVKNNTSNESSSSHIEIKPLAELERLEITRALTYFNKNVARASQALGVHPSTLHRKLKAMNLEF